MIYTPNGCIYNDGGTLVRCHDFTPGHMGHFWHLQQYFRRYTDAVRHRKEMRKNGSLHDSICWFDYCPNAPKNVRVANVRP